MEKHFWKLFLLALFCVGLIFNNFFIFYPHVKKLKTNEGPR